MLLTLDVGNSQIFCGVYDGDDLKATFRRTSSVRASSDEFGTFFRTMLRENEIDPEQIDMAAICSVAPDAVHSLRNCFRKYFRFEPFLLQPGAKTGLKIRYRNPLEVGADKMQIVVPSLSILAEPSVAVVDQVALKHGTSKVATEYLQHLYSKEGQEIIARNFYRPRDPDVAKKYAQQFQPPKSTMVTKAAKDHFEEGGSFDQIYGAK